MFQKDRKSFLIILSIAMPFAFSVWHVLLNNFVVERAGFTGQEIGMLQSIREVPGFLAFTVIFVLMFFRQQSFSVLSLALLGVGTGIVGFFPSEYGLYATTFLMSVGFHYQETIQQSLTLQWISKDDAAVFLGRLVSFRSMAGLLAFFGVLGLQAIDIDYTYIYILGGTVCLAGVFILWLRFPHFEDKVKQKNELILRKKYWLFYLLTFFAGARRQIFVVFAGFLLVEKFGYTAKEITILFIINSLLNIWIAPLIGKFVKRFGERYTLMFEYIGLILIFVSYAFVNSPIVAAGLYLLDHLFFSLAIALKTYFQKIADPEDISSTTGVSFSINHIAAIILPVLLGLVWIQSHELVFFIGAGIGFLSFVFSFLIPKAPKQGLETTLIKV